MGLAFQMTPERILTRDFPAEDSLCSMIRVRSPHLLLCPFAIFAVFALKDLRRIHAIVVPAS